MTAPRLPRRLVVGLTSAALLGGVVGVVPLLGSASAAGCPTWTDPKGDAAWHDPIAGQADPTGASADAQMDIVSSSLSVVGDTLVGTITTDGLSDTNSDFGDEFGFDFTVNGKAVNLYADRDPTGGTAGFVPAADATATYDLAKKTVVITAKLSELDKSAGGATAGKQVTGISSYSANQLLAQGTVINYDDAATTATLTVSPDCGGGSAPAATGAPTPTGSGSPSPTPSGTPSPTPTSSVGADGLFLQPRKNCVQYKDGTGDADPLGDPAGFDQEDALDITQLNLKSTSGQLQLFVGIVDPSAGLFNTWSGPVYTTGFTVNGKAVSLSAGADGPATATVGGTATDLKASIKIDAKNKNVVFTVPLDGLSKAVGTAVAAGTKVTVPTVSTAADSQLGPVDADDAAGTTDAQKTYTYGDNSCFLPPPGVISLDADATGQYGDATELFATLNDADGSPVQGVSLTAVLSGGRAVTAKTDDDGIADLRVPLLLAAGAKTLTVTYAGNGEVGPAKATKGFTVVAEKTVLKLAGSRGGATATLLDDDRHPVAGRYVTLTIGSAKKSVKTNAKGVAVVTGLKRGTVVKASFLPVKGYYLGTKTLTVKAL